MTDLTGEGVRVLLIGTGTHTGPTLSSVPAVAPTLEARRRSFTERCGVSSDKVHVLPDPSDARTMAAAISEEAVLARTTPMVYFEGHGLLGPGNELYPATSSPDKLTPGMAASRRWRRPPRLTRMPH